MTAQSPARGLYHGAFPDDFRTRLCDHLREYGRPITETADGVTLQFGQATIRIALTHDTLDILFTNADAAQLYQLREMAIYMLDHLHPAAGAGAGIEWQGFPPQTGTPPNFHLARLVRREKVGRNFLRLEMACADTAALTSGAMHFALLIPPTGRPPVWPQLNEKGRTVWPEGDDGLHRSAYTFVTLSPAEGRFTFDVFLHEGSRTSDWARTAPLGTEIGIQGPGGGEPPVSDYLLIAGDETALPAIRRILELSPPERDCHVLIETEDAEDRLLGDFPACKSLQWIDRSRGESLWDALCDQPVPAPGHSRFVWLAAEQKLVRKAKAHFRDTAKLQATEGYFSFYWVK